MVGRGGGRERKEEGRRGREEEEERGYLKRAKVNSSKHTSTTQDKQVQLT